MGAHVDVTGTITVGALPAEGFRFFTPEGERLWVAGWEPEYLHPEDGTLREGLTFRTRHGGEETLWLVSRLSVPTAVDYVRVTPGSRMGSVAVRLDAAEGRSRVTVSYRLTSLSDAADTTVEEFARAFPAYLASWQHAIEAVLTTSA
jgi:hypothetical protein